MGQKHLIGTGDFTWDAVERRSDRYGTVRLTRNDKDEDSGEHNVLFEPSLDALEGKKGRLYAEVLIPVKSPHMGDLARGIKPTTPDKGEIVVLGEGNLFIEHRRPQGVHEKAKHESDDDEMFRHLEAMFSKLSGGNVKITTSRSGNAGKTNPLKMKEPPPEVYDLIGLKPDDDRQKDWLNPHSFYRLHLSKVNLYFEELP